MMFCFLIAATLSMRLKVERSRVSNLPDFLVTIVADLGQLYISARSPNVYPG